MVSTKSYISRPWSPQPLFLSAHEGRKRKERKRESWRRRLSLSGSAIGVESAWKEREGGDVGEGVNDGNGDRRDRSMKRKGGERRENERKDMQRKRRR